MNDPSIRDLRKANRDSVGLVGGKAASLGELLQAGIPVPPGFVVTTEALKKGVTAPLKREILAAFDSLGVPQVAVRSSAIAEDSQSASWAGQLESYLNVGRAELIGAIEKCRDSIKSKRAEAYATEQGIHDDQRTVAVVVQAMVASDISGVLFTANPVTGSQDEFLLEAIHGLGEPLVQGEVAPESITVARDGQLLNRNPSKQQIKLVYKSGDNRQVAMTPPSTVVNDKLLQQLVNVGKVVEKHFGVPQDIEWAVEKGELYVVQSRPITTLAHAQKEDEHKQFDSKDYLLAFWVEGVSVFVTDVHVDVYRELEALFIIDQGMFKQYFTKAAYERALERGLEFYRAEHAFDDYQAGLTAHMQQFKDFYESHILGRTSLGLADLETFCKHTVKLCKDYTKMNFEFTDKAFTEQENDPSIKQNLAKAARFKDLVRSFMNTVLFEPDGYAAAVFGILGKQWDINPSVLENLTQAELLALFDKVRPDATKVDKRQTAFVESYNLDKPLEGKEAKTIIIEFRTPSKLRKQIQGQGASPGSASGKVRIVPVDYSNPDRVQAAIEAMQNGEILVAETTAPELMLACKKAAAIVTDMGGLLSHAAIVSRELGIPCVVGTMNASKVLENGDEIQVDGNAGIVNLIDRI